MMHQDRQEGGCVSIPCTGGIGIGDRGRFCLCCNVNRRLSCSEYSRQGCFSLVFSNCKLQKFNVPFMK